MTRPITRTIARLALAAAAVTAIGGTVAGAGDAATTCPTWHLRTTHVGSQHTWHPGDIGDARPGDPWNPSDATDGAHQDPWRPGTAHRAPTRDPWNPTGATAVVRSHTWHRAGDGADTCPSPTTT